MSGVLAKACVLSKIDSVQEKLSFLIILVTSYSRMCLVRSTYQMELCSNATFYLLWQKVFLVLLQGLNQCDGNLILDPMKRII